MIKTKEITLQDRENTLTFRLTEMPVTKTQFMLARLLALLLKCGIIDKDVGRLETADAFAAVGKAVDSGGLQQLGMIDPYEANEFALDLLECCEFKTDNVYTKMNKDLIDQYICDITTLVKLELEIVKLHIGFLQLGNASNTLTSDQGETKQDTSKPRISLRS